MKQNKLLHFARGLTAALVVTGLVAGAFPAPIDQAVGLSSYAAAAEGADDILQNVDWSITNYSVNDNRIEKDDRVTVTVDLKDPNTKYTSAITKNDIDGRSAAHPH